MRFFDYKRYDALVKYLWHFLSQDPRYEWVHPFQQLRGYSAQQAMTDSIKIRIQKEKSREEEENEGFFFPFKVTNSFQNENS